MINIHTIIAGHRSKSKATKSDQLISQTKSHKTPTSSDIPDLFFDEILVIYKLQRVEIMVLMYLYRKVWCKPNLYKKYGISQLLSHTDMVNSLNLSIEDVYQSLRKLEELGFIGTIRSGQYFVRKYFTRENDEKYEQTYDDFEV
jgi:DNA-binding MarR family transcriptional regulator